MPFGHVEVMKETFQRSLFIRSLNFLFFHSFSVCITAVAAAQEQNQ